MKIIIKIYVLTITLILISCKEIDSKKEDSNLNKQQRELKKESRDLDSLLSSTIRYMPTHIDLSKSDLLERFDVDYIFNDREFNVEKSKKDKIVHILLLKQYLYHLKKGNQGYDLKPMMKGKAEILISYFLDHNEINRSREFINSAVTFNILKEKNIVDSDIKQLIEEIQIETNRINK